MYDGYVVFKMSFKTNKTKLFVKEQNDYGKDNGIIIYFAKNFNSSN